MLWHRGRRDANRRRKCGVTTHRDVGIFAGMVVSIVHTGTPSRIHLISFRKATRNEEKILFKNLQV
jgi:uncharacterized DUF497 family protein